MVGPLSPPVSALFANSVQHFLFKFSNDLLPLPGGGLPRQRAGSNYLIVCL